MRHAGDKRGFTVVEILVAIGLFATVSAIMYSSFVLMIRAQETTDDLQQTYHAARVSMQRMAREISMSFLSKHVNAEEERSKTVFLGNRNKITFTALCNDRRIKESRESDQLVVEYFLKSIKGGGKGLYRRAKTLPDSDPEKGGTVELMAENVKSLEFDYWDREKEDWRNEWEVTSDDFEIGVPGLQLPEEVTDEEKTLQLPWRVRIRLVLRDENQDEYEFETQTALYMREALDFTYGGALTNQREVLRRAGGLPGNPGGVPVNTPGAR